MWHLAIPSSSSYLILILSILGYISTYSGFQTRIFPLAVLFLHAVLTTYEWDGWSASATVNWRIFPHILSTLLLLISFMYPSASLLPPLSVFCDVISLGMNSLYPSPTIPVTHGMYDSATTAATWFYVDPTSNERVSLPVQIWYPAIKSTSNNQSRRAPLWTTGKRPSHEYFEIAKYLAIQASVPSLLFSHLFKVPSASFVDLPVAIIKGGFPLLIMSHGYKGWKSCQSWLCEGLASYGYVVVAPDHRPDALGTVFPMEEEESIGFGYPLPDHIKPATEEERSFYNIQLQNRCTQIRTCIDRMSSPSSDNDALVASIIAATDARKIGLMGHSYGGGTVSAYSLRDSRVAATVALDSWMYPLSDHERNPRSMTSPVLFISGDSWQYHDYQNQFRRTVAASHPSGRNLIIRGGRHHNFNDCKKENLYR